MFWLQENLILMKKVGNWSELSCIRKEVTSYKIHTLVDMYQYIGCFNSSS